MVVLAFAMTIAGCSTQKNTATVADAVHPAHPFQLIGGFQGFGHALGFLHLPNDKGKLLVCLFVQSVKVAAQFAGQDKLVVPDRMVFFQIFLM